MLLAGALDATELEGFAAPDVAHMLSHHVVGGQKPQINSAVVCNLHVLSCCEP